MIPEARQHKPPVVALVLLAIGSIVLVAVLWRVFLRTQPASETPTNENRNGSFVIGTCGDGVCENVACLSTSCPQPETPENCPEDCGSEDANVNDEGRTGAENVNGTSGALNFSSVPQTLEEKAVCPVEESNLTPADAVQIAKESGLEQGTKPIEVRLAKSQAPLDECVWIVKNFLTPTSGKLYRIVDATQEFVEKATWSGE